MPAADHRGKHMKRVMTLCLLLASMGLAHAGTLVGDVPPDSLGRTPNGDEVLVTDQRGKVVVVTFWASWCGYCRQELPVLAGLQEAAGKDRMTVVAINYKDDRKVYRALARALKDVQLTMTHDLNGTIGKAYGVESIPRLLMIDREGKVAYVSVGYGEHSLDRIVDAANKLLAQPPTPGT
jgi:thiol-disulfide isomerase/thioredoxin